MTKKEYINEMQKMFSKLPVHILRYIYIIVEDVVEETE